MCLIIDNNVRGKVLLHDDPDYLPVTNALFDHKNLMVYGGKLRREYFQSNKIKRIVLRLDQAGIAKAIKESLVDNEAQAVVGLDICRSDDEHIIALARVSGARLLCSEDQDLHADFGNRTLINTPRGKIYQNQGHIGVLNSNCVNCNHH
jgi:hypothetical protein